MRLARCKSHIVTPGYGKQPAICGARPRVMVHGGPLAINCRRCLWLWYTLFAFIPDTWWAR